MSQNTTDIAKSKMTPGRVATPSLSAYHHKLADSSLTAVGQLQSFALSDFCSLR